MLFTQNELFVTFYLQVAENFNNKFLSRLSSKLKSFNAYFNEISWVNNVFAIFAYFKHHNFIIWCGFCMYEFLSILSLILPLLKLFFSFQNIHVYEPYKKTRIANISSNAQYLWEWSEKSSSLFIEKKKKKEIDSKKKSWQTHFCIDTFWCLLVYAIFNA